MDESVSAAYFSPSAPSLSIVVITCLDIAYSLIEEQDGRTKLPDDYVSFVTLLADPRYCATQLLVEDENKDEVLSSLECSNCIGICTFPCLHLPLEF
ncbi:hypothetical protein Dimus_009518 [Dionaea muscipula]